MSASHQLIKSSFLALHIQVTKPSSESKSESRGNKAEEVDKEAKHSVGMPQNNSTAAKDNTCSQLRWDTRTVNVIECLSSISL